MASTQPPSRGTKRPGEPLVGNNRIKSLYKPELVSIFIRVDTGRKKGRKAVEEDVEYQVPRGLIRGMSEYFDKAFDDTFVEGKTGKIVLDDVKPWVFECFIGWMYTQKVFWEHEDGPTEQGNVKHQPTVDRQTTNGHNNTVTNEALLDPVAWQWANLFELYIFADKYDTRRLRTKVIELVQVKSFLVKPTRYLRPNEFDHATVYNSLPDSSGLSKFMVDLRVYLTVPPRSDAEYDGTLPPRILYRLMSQATQLARCFRCANCTTGQPCDCPSHCDIKTTKAPYVDNLCAYHEHETEEEKKTCIQSWVQLRNEREIVIAV
ncbi:hypothetical protein LTS10_000798 [Elasticomyces elasticus]|nr:hypothetical protein LTS10_000798 [Elasticomyces elasticus]